ncbi:MAG: ribonuclease D, partial [Actinomycetota bacterium]|nr:ribonuclease D [Actinomycetota bacterium]
MTSGDEGAGGSPPESTPEVTTEPLLHPADGVPPVLTTATEFAAAAEAIAGADGPIAV